MKLVLSILFIAAAVISYPTYAQENPAAQKQALDKKLKTIQADKKGLERDTADAEKAYNSIKKDLVSTSAKVQKNQNQLHTIEERLEKLRDDQMRIKQELETEKEAMAKTITALQRIERTPPQAMIARPAAPIDTARGAMLLQRILPVLHEKARILKENSETYAANEKELEEKQKKLVKLSQGLEKEEKKLKTLVRDRKEQYAKLNSNLAERKKEIASVSKKAKNLSDLVKRLEIERTRAQEQAKKEQPIKQAALPKIGKSQLPLTGKIRTKYNQKDDFGAKSKGVSIEGRGGALVVAPMGGIIRFAGYFKNYGNMLIIEHQNGYHSLIAGLEKIDTVVDQSVSAGEPLGNLYRSDNGKPPSLYFELRHKGKAIDPARKFTELG